MTAKKPSKAFEQARKEGIDVETVGELIEVLQQFPKGLLIQQDFEMGCRVTIAKHIPGEYLAVSFDEVEPEDEDEDED